VGVVNNYTLTWGFLGIFYIIGFREALKLYKMESKNLQYVAVLLWGVAYFYAQSR